jgi:iron(III) transport system ATP-binding protein
MARLVLNGLTRAYGKLRVVDGITLEIEHGELVSLLGPSGCGKTTTLRLIAGFVTPSEGEIRMDDQVISAPGRVLPPEKRQMAMIFQSYAVWPHKTVAGNVGYGLKFKGIRGQDARERVARALRVVRLDGLDDRYPGELSGGQQQRVALARALVVEPNVLLLDEPLSNLDANLREEMRFEIRRLHDEFNITTVYVTHDQAEAMVTSDRIAVMNAGRVEQVGTAEQVYDRPASAFVAAFIGRTNLVPGVYRGDGQVAVADQLLSAADRPSGLSADAPVYLCVRPHDVALAAAATPPTTGAQSLRGRVTRATFLGDSREYLIDLDSGSSLRAATPPAERHAPGETVLVALAPARCRLLARAE